MGGLAYGEQACRDRPELNFASGPGATCAGVLSLYWVTIGLQLVFQFSAAICAAAQCIHSFRSSLWSLGAIATALGVKTANQAYSTLPLFKFANASAASAAGQPMRAEEGRRTAACVRADVVSHAASAATDQRGAAPAPCRRLIVPAAARLRRSGGARGRCGSVHWRQSGSRILRRCSLPRQAPGRRRRIR